MSVRSLGAVEIYLASPEGILDIPAVFDIMTVDIWAFLGRNALDGYSLMPSDVTNRLWHRVVISKKLLKMHDEWSM